MQHLQVQVVQFNIQNFSEVLKYFILYTINSNEILIHIKFFFSDSEDLSSGDFSEPNSPHRKTHPQDIPRIEIERDYLELQKKLNIEFERKQNEFERMRAIALTPGGSSSEKIGKDDRVISVSKTIAEDNLPAEFKKKLLEWRAKKSMSTIKEGESAGANSSKATSPTGSSSSTQETKKIDWQLWKTGQLKLEGQGLIQLPDEKDLPEDFQKKLGMIYF